MSTLLVACVPLREWSDGRMAGWSSVSSALRSSSASSEQIDFAVEVEESSSSSASSGTGALAEQLTTDGFLLVGDKNAPHTLTVFTNTSCPYCHEFQTTMFQAIAEEFVLPGTMNIQVAIVPLKKYPDSTVQAASLLCATAQGKGLPMLQELFGGRSHDRKSVIAMAKTVGLPQKAFTTCLDAKETKNILATQQSLINEHGVTLIPEFLLDSRQQIGLPSYADLRGWIQNNVNR